MDRLQLIAEPTRQAILRLVWDGERTAGDIAAHFDVTFGAVSQHLRILREGGLVDVRRDGARRYYRARRPALGPLGPALEAMWSTKLDQLAAAVEGDDDR